MDIHSSAFQMSIQGTKTPLVSHIVRMHLGILHKGCWAFVDGVVGQMPIGIRQMLGFIAVGPAREAH